MRFNINCAFNGTIALYDRINVECEIMQKCVNKFVSQTSDKIAVLPCGCSNNGLSLAEKI